MVLIVTQSSIADHFFFLPPEVNPGGILPSKWVEKVGNSSGGKVGSFSSGKIMGLKECRETYQGDELQEVYFSDGKDLYKLQPAKKAAFNRGKADRGTEVTIGWNDISTDDKKAGKAKQLPNITLAGKTCESFEYGSNKESTTYAVWNHILMMVDVKSNQMTMLKKAVKVDEKAAVSADKFKVPAGYILK